jgi:hypothetical protein
MSLGITQTLNSIPREFGSSDSSASGPCATTLDLEVGNPQGLVSQKTNFYNFAHNFANPPRRCLVVEPDETIPDGFVLVDRDIQSVAKIWPKFIQPVSHSFKEHYCDTQNFDIDHWLPDDYNVYEFELFQKWEQELITPDGILARSFLFVLNPVVAYFLRNRLCYWVDLKTHLLKFCKDVHHESITRDVPSFHLGKLYTS